MDGNSSRSLSETNEGDESESNKSNMQRVGSVVAIINYTFVCLVDESRPNSLGLSSAGDKGVNGGVKLCAGQERDR